MRTRRATGAVAALTAGVLVVAVPQASAAGDLTRIYTTDAEPGGMAEFQSYGETLYVTDIQRDGYHAWAGLYDNNGLMAKVETTSSNKAKKISFGLPEGYNVAVRVCLQDGNGPLKWCDWQDAEA